MGGTTRVEYRLSISMPKASLLLKLIDHVCNTRYRPCLNLSETWEPSIRGAGENILSLDVEALLLKHRALNIGYRCVRKPGLEIRPGADGSVYVPFTPLHGGNRHTLTSAYLNHVAIGIQKEHLDC
eukprot:scaffold212691_cov40-Prasinocladus_malaysianus.AAC.1